MTIEMREGHPARGDRPTNIGSIRAVYQ